MTTDLLIKYDSCPICKSNAIYHITDFPCSAHPLYHDSFPSNLSWSSCKACGHVFTTYYYSKAGQELLFSKYNESQVASEMMLPILPLASDIVNKVVSYLPNNQKPWNNNLYWMDIGCGDGTLVFVADEFGFKSFGIDTRAQAIENIKKIGYNAFEGTTSSIKLDAPVDVISMADVLEHIPFPNEALSQVSSALKDNGLLYISCPNYDSLLWKLMDKEGINPYWAEIEHHHNFSRVSLSQLLNTHDFKVIDYSVNRKYKAGMQIIARKIKSKIAQ